MKFTLIFVAGLCLFQFTNAYSCFRDPWMLSATPCDTCAMANPCANTANRCSCDRSFRNPANVCEYSNQPICQCGCGCANTPIYFPEVQYPSTIIDMNPFIYSSCSCY